MQAKVETTMYQKGGTMTAMAMEKALKLYTKDQRKDKDTARVTEQDEYGEGEEEKKKKKKRRRRRRRRRRRKEKSSIAF